MGNRRRPRAQRRPNVRRPGHVSKPSSSRTFLRPRTGALRGLAVSGAGRFCKDSAPAELALTRGRRSQQRWLAGLADRHRVARRVLFSQRAPRSFHGRDGGSEHRKAGRARSSRGRTVLIFGGSWPALKQSLQENLGAFTRKPKQISQKVTKETKGEGFAGRRHGPKSSTRSPRIRLALRSLRLLLSNQLRSSGFIHRGQSRQEELEKADHTFPLTISHDEKGLLPKPH